MFDPLAECKATDIAFLLDGSGSVNSDDFVAMKEFVIDLMRKLLKKNTRVSVWRLAGYSEIQIRWIRWPRPHPRSLTSISYSGNELSSTIISDS